MNGMSKPIRRGNRVFYITIAMVLSACVGVWIRGCQKARLAEAETRLVGYLGSHYVGHNQFPNELPVVAASFAWLPQPPRWYKLVFEDSAELKAFERAARHYAHAEPPDWVEVRVNADADALMGHVVDEGPYWWSPGGAARTCSVLYLRGVQRGSPRWIIFDDNGVVWIYAQNS